ncbi:MAG: CHAT domain-containing protein [Candidatus Aminicenantes bacterium]|jgi:WD40 repeat protein
MNSKAGKSPGQKPVIFLAFANDRMNNARYLRNLSREQRKIRNALEKAKQAGLCEIVERSNASVDDILDVFQDKNYNDRIAIFHYGGHADCYKLLLESFTGARSFAFREGLVSFFARQKGLRLIFLNACSTEQHALELKQAGVPAIIGTSQEINDEVAAQLAVRFYNGIANGFALERAWREAEDDIKIRKGSSNFNALYHYSQQEKHRDRFPWDIFFKEGAEKVKEWNLPDAVNDFLFGLPPIPRTYKLPDKPFLFLERYKREHAEIFFGRSYYIRGLYNRVTDKNSPPIILLYGQSGVGKSSLLEAGLLPRLEESHNIIYTRRDRDKGLLETFNKKLLRGVQGGGFLEKSPPEWKEIEARTGKPLVVILDQVEEVYTHPNINFHNELSDFLEELKTIFGNPMIYPRGKLILGYRKEYHLEIDRQLADNELDRIPLFLQPLNRQDIIEVVTGLTCTQRLKDKYNLEVEDRLPGIIADDILEDKDSPAAPTLQIVLTKMWEASKREDLSPIRQFTISQYQALWKAGLLMEDFFKQQMEKLRNWRKESVESGLVLDVLKFHTTGSGTACTRKIKEIRKMYRNCREIIDDLLNQLKNLYLITDTQQGKDETSLPHDILAPVIIKEYNDSDKPGQRAARILAARIRDFKRSSKEVWLNEADLLIVEQGKKGMRDIIPLEEQLLEESRKRKTQRNKRIKRNKIIRRISIAFVVILAIIAAWLWRVSWEGEKIRKINKAYYLNSLAQIKVEENPTVALRVLEAAWRLDKNDIVKKNLIKTYRENSFYKIVAKQNKGVNSAVFSPTGQFILTGSRDKTARLWDWAGNQLKVFNGHKGSVTSIAFSADSRFIFTGSEDKTARLWDLKGNQIKVFKGHESSVTSIAVSPDGRFIITGSDDKTVRLWYLKINRSRVFKGHKNSVISTAFSPDSRFIITGSRDKTARLWDLQGNELQDFRGGEHMVYSVAFSPDGQSILTGAGDGGVRLWSRKGVLLAAFIGHRDRINSVVFLPGAKYIITASEDASVRLWDLEGNELRSFKGHQGPINSAVLSPDYQYILTGSADKTIRLWKVHNPVKYFIGKGFGEPLSGEQKQEYGIED